MRSLEIGRYVGWNCSVRALLVALASVGLSLSAPANSAASVLASTDCLVGVAPQPVTRCGARGGTVPGKEFENFIALHNIWDSGDRVLDSSDLAHSEARASYGSVGVRTLTNTIAFTENFPNAQTNAYAVASATMTDIFRFMADGVPTGVLRPVVVGFELNRFASVLCPFGNAACNPCAILVA